MGNWCPKILDPKFTIQPTAKVKVGSTHHESLRSSNPMRTIRLWIYKDTCRSVGRFQITKESTHGSDSDMAPMK